MRPGSYTFLYERQLKNKELIDEQKVIIIFIIEFLFIYILLLQRMLECMEVFGSPGSTMIHTDPDPSINKQKKGKTFISTIFYGWRNVNVLT
jgi:hypothetical protein